MEIKRFEEIENSGFSMPWVSPVPLPWPCSVLCAHKWPLADHSQVLLLPQGAEREKTQMWNFKSAAQALLPCQVFPSTSKPSFPQGFVSEGSVLSPGLLHSWTALELGFHAVKFWFSWSSPVIPALPSEDLPSGSCLTLFDYSVQKALISKGFSLQLP